MKKKQSALKDILFLSISSFIVVAAWIGFNIYHSYVTSTITQDLQVQISPITPDFDTATLEKLKARKHVLPITKLSNSIKTEPTQSALEPAVVQNTPPATTTLSPTQAIIENDIPVTIDGE